MNICYVTDSGTDLPGTVTDTSNIFTVPLHYIFGNVVDEDLTREEFQLKLQKIWPTTSGPSVGEYAKIFQYVIKEGFDHIICLPISSGLSDSYNSALIASKSIDLGSAKIAVIDTKTISLGIGFIVEELTNLAKEDNCTFLSLVESAKNFYNKERFLIILNTLSNLVKGGRATYLQSQLSIILQIKPIITLDDNGKLKAINKVRTFSKAIEEVLKIVLSTSGIRKIGLIYSSEKSLAVEFSDKLWIFLNKRGYRFESEDITICQACLPICIHAGERALGVCLTV